MNKPNLTWGERAAIMAHYKSATDEQFCTAFGVQQAELNTARQLLASGQISAADNVDVESYASMFATGESVTSTVKPSTDEKPITATKREKAPKKRGRKGDNIKNAFAAIPATATPAEAFAAQHNVSIPVLRQAKRFDSSGQTGKVHVKKMAVDGNDDKVLCIWRDAE